MPQRRSAIRTAPGATATVDEQDEPQRRQPILALNALKTESDESEQQGYMDIFAECMTGIRNPRAHRSEYLDSPDRALEMITWGQHLRLKLDRAQLVTNTDQAARRSKGTGS
jgi:hypothetical protein